jgi:DNA-binding LacI/PurR family transcriptional regulator
MEPVRRKALISAAIEAIHELQDRGLRVPEDVAVVGFDDIDMARIVRPALTTCHVHRELLGAMGVRRLIERAADPKAPALALAFDTVFVERASARAPK